MAGNGMQLQRVVGLRAVQKERHRNDRDVRQPEGNQYQPPPGKVEKGGKQMQFHKQ
jgi:hypothetical protein